MIIHHSTLNAAMLANVKNGPHPHICIKPDGTVESTDGRAAIQLRHSMTQDDESPLEQKRIYGVADAMRVLKSAKAAQHFNMAVYPDGTLKNGSLSIEAIDSDRWPDIERVKPNDHQVNGSFDVNIDLRLIKIVVDTLTSFVKDSNDTPTKKWQVTLSFPKWTTSNGEATPDGEMNNERQFTMAYESDSAAATAIIMPMIAPRKKE